MPSSSFMIVLAIAPLAACAGSARGRDAAPPEVSASAPESVADQRVSGLPAWGAAPPTRASGASERCWEVHHVAEPTTLFELEFEGLLTQYLYGRLVSVSGTVVTDSCNVVRQDLTTRLGMEPTREPIDPTATRLVWTTGDTQIGLICPSPGGGAWVSMQPANLDIQAAMDAAGCHPGGEEEEKEDRGGRLTEEFLEKLERRESEHPPWQGAEDLLPWL